MAQLVIFLIILSKRKEGAMKCRLFDKSDQNPCQDKVEKNKPITEKSSQTSFPKDSVEIWQNLQDYMEQKIKEKESNHSYTPTYRY